MNVVYDDVVNILEGYAADAGDRHVGVAGVDGLVAVDDELMFEIYGHFGSENDPQRLGLDHGMAEIAQLGVHSVEVGGVGDDVDHSAFAAHRCSPEPNEVVRQALAIVSPVRVALPAVVYRVLGAALVFRDSWQQESSQD